jgi:hypothetical protein
MKKIYSLMLAFFVVNISFAQLVNIPDANFKDTLLNYEPVIDINNDNEIQVSEAENYSGVIDVSIDDFELDKKIYDLTGIEAFINITELHVLGHEFSGLSLDFSNNTELLVLDIGYTGFDQLNIDHNDKLQELNISGYRNAIDVSHLTNLEELNIRHTGFSSIDLSQNTKLKKLQFFASDISSIDLSQNTDLEWLTSGGSPLQTLDVSNNTKLQYLEMQSSDYDSIDLSKNVNLEHIACYGSKVVEFDLSNNINLKYFGCGNNIFTSLDFSNNINLQSFVSQGNDSLETINLKNGNNHNLYFSALNHPLLYQVCVDSVEYAVNNFTNVDDPGIFDDCDVTTFIGTSERIMENMFSVYPNPLIYNSLTILKNKNVEVSEFSILTLSGQEYRVVLETETSDRFVIDIPNFTDKLFFLKLTSNNRVYIFKILKE